jgi:glycosyltransferase involved in cell wall biosynthesis
MKILHISTIVEWRGGDKQLLTTYEILKSEKDIEHFILCPEGSVLAGKCKEMSIPYFTAPRNSKFSIPILKKIIKVVKAENIDVIHVHDSTALSLTLLAIKFLPGVKLVYSRKRNNIVKNNFVKKLKYNSNRINHIICVSQAVKDVLIPVLTKPEKAQVIYDGIDVDEISRHPGSNLLREQYNIDKETLIIGNIAGLTRQKDLFTFIDAANSILKQSKVKMKFFIVGEGILENDLKEYSKSLNLSENIIFTGFRNDVNKILPEFDIFLISSETEGLPLSILEAFACKVPVVATAAGGTGEAVKNGVTGMISPIKDGNALAENVMEVLDNPEMAEILKKNAFQLVNEKFTLEVMKREYYKFYKSLETS